MPASRAPKIASAAQALDSDPAQARRALAAQAVELKKVGEAIKDARLFEAAAALEACTAGGMARAELIKRIDGLMGFLVEDGGDRGAA